MSRGISKLTRLEFTCKVTVKKKVICESDFRDHISRKQWRKAMLIFTVMLDAQLCLGLEAVPIMPCDTQCFGATPKCFESKVLPLRSRRYRSWCGI